MFRMVAKVSEAVSAALLAVIFVIFVTSVYMPKTHAVNARPAEKAAGRASCPRCT